MLFDPNVSAIKKGPRLLFSTIVVLGLFGPIDAPYYWHGYLFVVSMYLNIAIYLVGACERYLIFVGIIFFSVIGALTYFFCNVFYLVMTDAYGPGFKSTALGLTPFLVVCTAIACALLTKSDSSEFEIVGNKVARLNCRENYRYGGLVAGFATLLAGWLIKAIGPSNTGLIAVVGGTAVCLGIVFYFRKTIRGLRTLRQHERRMPVPYTFMRIDEIRTARTRWWLGRLCKWVSSKCKQPSA